MSAHDSEVVETVEHLATRSISPQPKRFRWRVVIMAAVAVLALPRPSNATSGDARCIHWLAPDLLDEIQASPSIVLDLKGGCQRPERLIILGEDCEPCPGGHAGPTLSGIEPYTYDTLGYMLDVYHGPTGSITWALKPINDLVTLRPGWLKVTFACLNLKGEEISTETLWVRIKSTLCDAIGCHEIASTAFQNSSVSLQLNLGKASMGTDAGLLSVYQVAPTNNLYTPLTLQYYLTNSECQIITNADRKSVV